MSGFARKGDIMSDEKASDVGRAYAPAPNCGQRHRAGPHPAQYPALKGAIKETGLIDEPAWNVRG
jgi:hypothetical protein